MNQYKNLTEETYSSKEVFAGKLLHAYDDEVTLPNGNMSTREYVKHIGAVAVVPLKDDGKVIVEDIFRYPVHKVVKEIPAGKLNSKQEDRLEAAKRELVEETGITADEWIELGKYNGAPAYSDEEITLFLAKGLHYGKQKLDEDEFLNVSEVELSKLILEVMSGEIVDGKTQVALLKAAIHEGLV